MEYERIQKGVKEHLKRQLMELLKQNQEIADTRTGNAIEKEALEREVSALEQKAEQAKQEVVAEQTTTSPQNHEMKHEGAQSLRADEQMIIDSAAAF